MFHDDVTGSNSYQPSSQGVSPQSLPLSSSFIENSPSLSDLDIELLKAAFNIVQFNQWFDKNTIFRLIRQNPVLSSSEASVERTLIKAEGAGIIKVGLNGSGRRATRFEFINSNTFNKDTARNADSVFTNETNEKNEQTFNDDLEDLKSSRSEKEKLSESLTQDGDVGIAIKVIEKEIAVIQLKILRSQQKIEDLQKAIKHLSDDHKE